MELLIDSKSRTPRFILIALVIILSQGAFARAETTYGHKDSSGAFIPKVTVEVGSEVIKIEKVRPREDFRSIEIRINPGNTALDRNKSLLEIVWISEAGKEGRPLPFTGPRYDPRNKAFRDTMTKSRAIKIIDESDKKLFENKDFTQLFLLAVEGKRLKPEAAGTGDATRPQLPEPSEPAIRIDKESIDFSSSNYKKGITLNIDNPTGFNQTIGLEFPEEGLFYLINVGRKLEQSPIAEQNWDRIVIPPDSGIFVILIPEAEPVYLTQLNGKEIKVKVYEENRVSQVKTIPISTSGELRLSSGNEVTDASGDESSPDLTFVPPDQNTTEIEGPEESPEEGPEEGPEPEARPETGPSPTGTEAVASTGLGYMAWGIIIGAVALSLGAWGYVIFFLLPKIQALEDRLAKNEMFLHGSREAIREELEHTKAEILKERFQDFPEE